MILLSVFMCLIFWSCPKSHLFDKKKPKAYSLYWQYFFFGCNKKIFLMNILFCGCRIWFVLLTDKKFNLRIIHVYNSSKLNYLCMRKQTFHWIAPRLIQSLVCNNHVVICCLSVCLFVFLATWTKRAGDFWSKSVLPK